MKKDVFFEKMKKWGTGNVLEFKKQSTDES